METLVSIKCLNSYSCPPSRSWMQISNFCRWFWMPSYLLVLQPKRNCNTTFIFENPIHRFFLHRIMLSPFGYTKFETNDHFRNNKDCSHSHERKAIFFLGWMSNSFIKKSTISSKYNQTKQHQYTNILHHIINITKWNFQIC